MTSINDTSAKRFFAHASSLTPDSFLYTDSESPEWLDDVIDYQLSEFFTTMVHNTAILSMSSPNKRKAFYQVTDSGDGPIAYEGRTSENWFEEA